MARNKVLERAKVTPPSGRNAVDLSQEKSFAQLSADLNIAYIQPVVAGTRGKISRTCFTRTAQVVSPAFHRVTEHFDFFIVPIHSLWRYWDNWKLNINDLQDTTLVDFLSTGSPDLALPAGVPRLDFTNLCKRMGYYNLNSGSAVSSYIRACNDALRLIEQCRQGCMQDAANTADVAGRANVLHLFPEAAYQKVYFEHFRNSAYESNNPYAYNLDWITKKTQNQHYLMPTAPSDITQTPTMDTFVARELFKMRRVNYRNDYFHNIYPALNYVLSTPNGSSFSVPSSVGFAQGAFSTTGTASSVDGGNGAIGSARAGFGITSSGSTAYGTAQQIRALFALDKLMRASAYAPKRVREQYKAQFGVDVPEDEDMRSQRIGSFQSAVEFVEVTNMAQTSLDALGELGAKGVGGEKKAQVLNYYAKWDSIIIGVHYFLPRARYDSFGLNPWNGKILREEFYQKAFENLGLRPIYVSAFNNEGTDANRNTMIGWTVPNFEYKILPDLNEGPFKVNFTQVVNNSGTISYQNSAQNELRTFVPHSLRTVYMNRSAEYFKVAAEDLDNLFVVAVPDDHRIGYYQFFGDFRISHAAVIPMSIHGQPIL